MVDNRSVMIDDPHQQWQQLACLWQIMTECTWNVPFDRSELWHHQDARADGWSYDGQTTRARISTTSGNRLTVSMIRKHVVPLAKHQMWYHWTHDDTFVVSKHVGRTIARSAHKSNKCSGCQSLVPSPFVQQWIRIHMCSWCLHSRLSLRVPVGGSLVNHSM
jgi:hypothetical protein